MSEYPQVPLARFRADLGNTIANSAHGGQRQVITRNGKSVAALVPVSDYAALMEREDA